MAAAAWTAVLILALVAAADASDQARHERSARDAIDEQVRDVAGGLDASIRERHSVLERTAVLVAISPDLDNASFERFATGLAADEPGLKSLHVIRANGQSMSYPPGSGGTLARLTGSPATPDERVIGPWLEPGAPAAFMLVRPVYAALEAGDPGTFWGSAAGVFYLDPMLSEARLPGWPGDAVFSLRGTDGLGDAGAAFHGDVAVFDEDPETATLAIGGGEWVLGALPAAGWPDASPASPWIRTGGVLVAVLAGALVGVLVSEPARLRLAVVAATREATESERRFRAVSDTALDGFVTVDAAGLITYVNRAAERTYGLHAEDLIGQRLGDAFPAEAGLVDRLATLPMGDPRLADRYELEGRRRDGRPVPLEVSMSRWQAGGASYATLIIRDITERREALRYQARLAAMLDASPDYVFVADANGRLEYLNPAARAALGIPEDRPAAAVKLTDVYPEAHHATLWEKALPIAMETGAWRGEGHLVVPDGPPRPVSQIFVAQPGFEGGPGSVAIVARDITDEQRARDELLREKERFRTLSDAAFEGIVIHDQGKILEANTAFARLFGYPLEELLGKHVLDLVDASARDRVVERLRNPADDAYEVLCRRKNGSTFTVEVAAKHFPFKDRIVRVTAVRDITERKRAEEANRVATDRLLEIERLREIDTFKTQLLNTASHELNTPITPIRLQLHILKNQRLGTLSEKHQKAVEVLDRNVERLALLVQDILDVARLQSGRLRIHKEPLELETIVREAVDAFEEPARQGGVRLALKAHEGLWVIGDGHRLTQVLFNVLSNALKFTPSGGSIKVVAERRDGLVRVAIEDTGIGLTSEQIGRLFRPFSQVHDTMETTQSGTGLGLYICRGILEEHGGRITCSSQGPGRGTSFEFEVPVATTEDLSAVAPRAPRKEEGPSASDAE